MEEVIKLYQALTTNINLSEPITASLFTLFSAVMLRLLYKQTYLYLTAEPKPEKFSEEGALILRILEAPNAIGDWHLCANGISTYTTFESLGIILTGPGAFDVVVDNNRLYWSTLTRADVCAIKKAAWKLYTRLVNISAEKRAGKTYRALEKLATFANRPCNQAPLGLGFNAFSKNSEPV